MEPDVMNFLITIAPPEDAKGEQRHLYRRLYFTERLSAEIIFDAITLEQFNSDRISLFVIQANGETYPLKFK